MARTKRSRSLLLYMWWSWRKKRGSLRRFAVHPINRWRHMYGEYHHLMPQLRNHSEKFHEYLRMTPQSFNHLLELCAPNLREKSTNFCRAVPPEERLVVTLRFLATGDSFRSLAFHFRLGKETVRTIIKKTVRVLFERLQPLHMPVPNASMWIKTAEGFFQRWNFPLCVGSIDGKHVQINAPAHSGTLHYNYKSHFSIVLMAVVDAVGKFLVIDVGGFGSCSDGGIFQETNFFKLLQANKLHLPEPSKIPNTNIELPYMFVGDEAFALMTNLMRPFPRRSLDNEKRIFNYRLSRARRQVECAFGVMSSTWRIMRKPIKTATVFAIDIVKAVCVLHNFTRDKESDYINQVVQTDTDVQHWRGLPQVSGRAHNEAVAVRNALMSYFLSPAGSLPWQADLLPHTSGALDL